MTNKIKLLRMERQHLVQPADEAEYTALYRDLQPGQNVYWSGFGDPPTITHRAAFNDMEFNRKRQSRRELIKGRFAGGNLGWIVLEDLELYAVAFMKPLTKPTERQLSLLDLIRREPLTIHQMKEETGMLVKEITPALHRLQEAFLIYEDQYDGEWDRGWHMMADMFPDVDFTRFTRHTALLELLQRFARRLVVFDTKMAKSFFKLPEKDIKNAVAELADSGVLAEIDNAYILREDLDMAADYSPKPISSVFAMHRNDIMVKANEFWLKERFTHTHPDTLYYLLIDGEFRGVVAGKFRYTVEVEDVIVDLPAQDAAARKAEILCAVQQLCGEHSKISRYQGADLP